MEIEFSISFCLYLYMKTYNYIYLITNNINEKIYVGKHSTDNLNDGYMGSGVVLKHAYNKYGKEHFSKKILAYADTEEKLNWFECFYIKKYNARTKGYNLTDGGDGSLGCEPWNKGVKWSEEQKRKLSELAKGKHHSKETRKKMSETRKGKPIWNKGKTLSEEHKQKIREANKGRTFSEERNHKIRAALKGKPMSEETKHKISESMKRKKGAI